MSFWSWASSSNGWWMVGILKSCCSASWARLFWINRAFGHRIRPYIFRRFERCLFTNLPSLRLPSPLLNYLMILLGVVDPWRSKIEVILVRQLRVDSYRTSLLLDCWQNSPFLPISVCVRRSHLRLFLEFSLSHRLGRLTNHLQVLVLSQFQDTRSNISQIPQLRISSVYHDRQWSFLLLTSLVLCDS